MLKRLRIDKGGLHLLAVILIALVLSIANRFGSHQVKAQTVVTDPALELLMSEIIIGFTRLHKLEDEVDYLNERVEYQATLIRMAFDEIEHLKTEGQVAQPQIKPTATSEFIAE